MLASVLLAYFRYRATCGDQVYGLLGVISSPAHWNLASLPQALKPDEVARLLASFNAPLPSPKRGYAIVRCALDLGLRRGEIAKLQLTDIDWRNGTVTIKHTKALRQDTLPLPAVTGQALADYVRFERPKTTNQAVFVRVLAPHDQPIGPDVIYRVIRDAYRRIGLKHGQGLLQHLAINHTAEAWRCFRSWLRTMNPDMPPSELIVANALRITLPAFLAVPASAPDLMKIITKYRRHDPPFESERMTA